MKQYNTNSWNAFRKSVLELDGFKCSVCGKSEEETVLQVHHKRYINGLKPWEYGTSDCITLCRGCHAAEHGIVKPKVGWEYQGEDDLGDLIGTCEYCGSSLRHVFYVYHENWGTIEVGTYCCDSLTDTNIASNLMESQRRFDGRKERFIKSKRWKIDNGIHRIHRIQHGNFDIEIHQKELEYFIKIQGFKGNKTYETIEIAKQLVFDLIESGELMEYFRNHNINIEKENKKRKKK